MRDHITNETTREHADTETPIDIGIERRTLRWCGRKPMTKENCYLDAMAENNKIK